MDELSKMKQLDWYNANKDEYLNKRRVMANELCAEFNITKFSDTVKRREILNNLEIEMGEYSNILASFNCDYGFNIKIGHHTFINRGAYLMDGAPIIIGNNVLIGPNCGIYTNTHPLGYLNRNEGISKAKPIIIEDNVWIGGDVTILGGVTIHKNSVIGAKSLVNKDIDENTLAYGVPIQMIRKIEKEEM